MNPSFSEQLKAARSYDDKIKVIETAVNLLLVAQAQLQERLEQPRRGSKITKFLTVKAMTRIMDCVGDQDKVFMLKFFAKKYSEQNGLEIQKSGDKSVFERYHPDAAAYAMEQVKKEL